MGVQVLWLKGLLVVIRYLVGFGFLGLALGLQARSYLRFPVGDFGVGGFRLVIG